MTLFSRRKGFLSLEYAILIVTLVAALLAMGVYLRRSICSKLRQAGDTFGYGRQYKR